MATVIKASTNNASKYFLLDGLDYEKGVYTLFYDSVITNSSNVLDEDLVRVGIRNRVDHSEILQSPLLVTNWNNGSADYSDFDTLIAAISDLVGQPADGGGDVTAGAVIGDNLLVRGDGAVKGIQKTGITVDDSDNLTGLGTLNTKVIANLLSNVSEDTSPQAGGEFDLQAHSIGGTVQTATGDGTTTIDWKLGNMFAFQFGAFNETFTFTAPTKPGTFILKLVQDSVGSRTVTWPGTVEWPAGTAPTLTTTLTTGTDIITFFWDGTSYFGVDALDFS